MAVITEQEYLKLKEVGQKLFVLIGDDLNEISDRYCRPGGWLQEHRREEDFNEMVIALALFAQLLDLNTDSLEHS